MEIILIKVHLNFLYLHDNIKFQFINFKLFFRFFIKKKSYPIFFGKIHKII